MRAAAIALCLALLSCSGNRQEKAGCLPQQEPEQLPAMRSDAGLWLTLRPQKTELDEGEPIVLVAEFENHTDEDIVLPSFSFGGYHGRMISRDGAIEAAKMCIHMAPWPDCVILALPIEPIHEWHVIPARGRTSHTFGFQDAVSLEAGALPLGNYTVCLEYSAASTFPLDHGIIVFPIEGDWHVVSNSVRICVVECRRESDPEGCTERRCASCEAHQSSSPSQARRASWMALALACMLLWALRRKRLRACARAAGR